LIFWLGDYEGSWGRICFVLRFSLARDSNDNHVLMLDVLYINSGKNFWAGNCVVLGFYSLFHTMEKPFLLLSLNSSPFYTAAVGY